VRDVISDAIHPLACDDVSK